MRPSAVKLVLIASFIGQLAAHASDLKKPGCDLAAIERILTATPETMVRRTQLLQAPVDPKMDL